MACDLAEFVGAALGFHLLFGMPLLPAGLLTGLVTFAILSAELRGVRHLEAVITVLVGIIVAGFAFQIFHSNPDGGAAVKGLLTPQFSDSESVLLAAGILGATVMPHVIYLHSSLTQRRVVGANADERRRIFRFEQIDVVIAMTIAGLVNMAMLIMAAGIFHSRGLTNIGDIDEAYRGLGTIVGNHADVIFGIALLASGLSSSSVGTLAGQVVMQGYINRSDPALPAAHHHDGAGADRARDPGHQPVQRAHHLAGRAFLRDPVRAHPARDVLPQPRADGRPRQPARHEHRGLPRGGGDRVAQRVPALRHDPRLEPLTS